ncbi:MAG: DedA family protein [Candidatus Pacebacteria bacterium]|nr:DedA family protein [Candidatus Paceibacterota bacterium]
MQVLIHNIELWIDSSKYFLLFWGAFLEGPVVMISGGFLYQIGQLNFFQMYIALVAGDFVADIMWYLVGFYGGNKVVTKYGSFFNITPEIVEKVKLRFHTYQTSILLVSKLTMGFGFSLATLITAGTLRIPFKKYAIINLLAGFIWVLFLVAIGFFFGNVYSLITRPLKIAFICLAIVVVIVVLRTVNRYLVNTKV